MHYSGLARGVAYHTSRQVNELVGQEHDESEGREEGAGMCARRQRPHLTGTSLRTF